MNGLFAAFAQFAFPAQRLFDRVPRDAREHRVEEGAHSSFVVSLLGRPQLTAFVSCDLLSM
jgi:hypothetical protein